MTKKRIFFSSLTSFKERFCNSELEFVSSREGRAEGRMYSTNAIVINEI